MVSRSKSQITLHAQLIRLHASFHSFLSPICCFLSWTKLHSKTAFSTPVLCSRSETFFKTGASPTLNHGLQILFPPNPRPHPDLQSLTVSPPHLSLLCSGWSAAGATLWTPWASISGSTQSPIVTAAVSPTTIITTHQRPPKSLG